MRFLLTFLLILSSFSFAANSYFQQEVHYKIDVKLNVREKTYSGHEQLLYINHSPDTLSYVWMHLYPNAYRSNNTPFARQQEKHRKSRFYFSDSSERGYLNLNRIEAQGRTLNYQLKEDAIDEVKIDLPTPLLPGDTIVFDIDFQGKFPKMFSRMGTWGNYYFAATQWYPKMVVYDRFGWHPDSYLDQGEFYGEYGTFDVKITLPKLFVVEATGLLKDDPEEEKFVRQIVDTTRYFLNLDKYNRKQFIKKWIKSRKEQLDLEEIKTVHFYAKNVHNFAWFAGLDYLILQKVHNNGVLTNVLVQPASAYDWRHVPDYVQKTVKFYSSHVGPYQYPKASVVQGALRAGGGMEYPMVTIISIPYSSWTNILEMVVMHEVGHNWFMGMLGSDERASAFLDEGMNSFVEMKYMEHYYGKYNLTNFKKLLFGFDLFRDIGEWQTMQITYGTLASMRLDLPMNLRAEAYNSSNYNAISYHKGALMLLALEEYLSPAVFWRGMHEYFKRWNGKHPAVEDFFQTMEDVSGKDLNEFMENWYNSTKYCDFTIKKVAYFDKGNERTVSVFVENKGTMKNMPAPVQLITVSGDTLEKWWAANPQEPLVFKVKEKVKKIEVNPRHTIFELSYINNQSALWPPIKINLIPQIPDFEHYEINLMPFYWYESFVDKHRLGAMIWGGNPIFNQWFWTGKMFYATKSQKIGYAFSLSNRFRLPVANFTDVKAEWFDEDGMRKARLLIKNHFQKPGTDYPIKKLNFSFESVDLYNGNYYEKSMFQESKYGLVTVEGQLKNNKMLGGLTATMRLQKGLKIQKENMNFVKLETEVNWWKRPWKNTWFNVYGYLGNIWGNKFPLQEYIFAAGDIDPRHQRMAFARRGKFAPNRYFTFGQGLRMYGFTDPDNPYFKGKSGASLSLTCKPYRHIPSLYVSAAVLSNKTMDFNQEKLFAEAGLKTNLKGINMIFPLYVSDPPPGGKHFDFRFLFEYQFRLRLGF